MWYRGCNYGSMLDTWWSMEVVTLHATSWTLKTRIGLHMLLFSSASFFGHSSPHITTSLLLRKDVWGLTVWLCFRRHCFVQRSNSFSSVIVESCYYLAAAHDMKRPACAAAAGGHRKNHQEDGQHVVKTNDEKRKPADCTHPTSMKTASGSNRHRSRMTCRACGMVLYNVPRHLNPSAPPPKGWEQIWQQLKYWEQIEIRRIVCRWWTQRLTWTQKAQKRRRHVVCCLSVAGYLFLLLVICFCCFCCLLLLLLLLWLWLLVVGFFVCWLRAVAAMMHCGGFCAHSSATCFHGIL